MQARLIYFANLVHPVMALGEKVFEEKGKVTGMDLESVHPTEGTKLKVNFVSEIKGIGRFPTGNNLGSGTIHQYPHGVWDGSYSGVITTQEGEQVFWWGHEKSKVDEGGKVRGIVLVSVFTHSQRLSWLNRTIMAMEVELNPTSMEFVGTAYEWK